jgi:hypothetical protein
MNIIFRPHFFGGKNNNFDSIFVPLSLKTVLKYNPDSIIYFISNDPLFVEKNFSCPPQNLKCFVFEDFQDDKTNEFNNNYNLDNTRYNMNNREKTVIRNNKISKLFVNSKHFYRYVFKSILYCFDIIWN